MTLVTNKTASYGSGGISAIGGCVARHQWIFVLLAIVFLVLVVRRLAGSARSQTEIVVESPSHHFGRISPGREFSHCFQLRNRGQRQLRIQEIRASCGCVTTTPGGGVIEPGATTSVFVTLKTHGMRPPLEVRKTVTASFMDDADPPIQLSIRGELAANILWTPPKITFDNLKSDASSSAVLTVSRQLLTTEEFATVRLGVLPPYLRARIRRRTADLLECELLFEGIRAPTALPPLRIQYLSAGLTQEDLVPLACRERSQITPSCFFATLDRPNCSELRLKRITLSNFRITPENAKIVDVRPIGARVSEAFGWSAEGQELSVWVQRVPSERNFRGLLLISYQSPASLSLGRIPLPLRLFVANADEGVPVGTSATTTTSAVTR